MNTESLSRAERTAVLARLAHELTICARTTYEVGTDDVLEPRALRACNEVLHRVTAAVREHLMGTEGWPFETILEMVREFGTRYNRVGEINFALNRAMQQNAPK